MDMPKWNADNLCRACIEEVNTLKTGEAGAYVNIFEIPELMNKLSACISNEFAAANKYSKYLCIGCYQNVNAFFQFRRMCLKSMRHFDKLITADTLSCEEAKPIPIPCETVIKEEYNSALQVLIIDRANESAILEENVDYLPNYNKNTKGEMGTTKVLRKRKNSNINERQSRRKRALHTAVKATVDHLESAATTKDERISDDDTEPKDDNNSVNNSSLNECSGPPETKPSASKATKGNTSNTTIYNCEHRLTAHNPEDKGLIPYPCTHEDCNKSFTSLSDPKAHLNQQGNAASIEFLCDQDGCDKVYKNKPALNMHKRKIHKLGRELKSHVCEICGKIFKRTTLLRAHRYTHKDKSEQPYACDQPNCTRRFAQKANLKVHLKRHAGIKNYVCSHCGVRKTTREELTFHMNSHTLERKWPCRFCKTICNSAGILKTHVRTVHERLKEYACRYCDLKFARPDTRKCHEMRHTGEKPNICSECGRGFTQPAALRKHMKVHGRQQGHSVIANNLSKSKQERLKVYACHHCDLKFAKPDTRKYHEMRHTGEKPNVCTECGKAFIQPAALRTHMKVHGRKQERSAIANNLSNSNQLMPNESEPIISKNGSLTGFVS